MKRVIGLPGDTIELRDNQLVINGKPIEYGPIRAEMVQELPASERSAYRYVTERLPENNHALALTPVRPARRDFGPLQIPAGQYFMMGDNRDDSFDSRYYGPVERSQIVGRAEGIVVSLDHGRYWLPRANRFAKPF